MSASRRATSDCTLGLSARRREIARRLGGGELDEGVEHGARDAERHRRHAAGIEALHGEGIERARVAAQRRILARAGEGLGHEDVGAGVAFRGRAAHAERVPVVDRRRLGLGHQHRAHGRPAEAVEAQRAVGLDDVAVGADPGGLAVARREMPFAGDAIAAGRGDELVLVGRSPGDQAARIAVDRARRLERDEGRDQGRAVGHEHVPAQRAVVAGDLLDRRDIDPGLDLLAAQRARQQQAEQPRTRAAR